MRLVAEGLSRSFGTRRIIGPLTFTLESGRVLGVAGQNGSGKTTLLRTLAGLIRPSGGSAKIFFDGEEAAGHEPRDIPWRIGWVAPDLALYGELTAEENLMFFAGVHGLAFAPGRARALLEGVGLARDSHSKKSLSSLSTGQRQRVKLAYATLHDPAVLLLDEPGANLDEAGRSVVENVVAAQRTRGIAIIASNDPRDLRLADETLSL